MDIWQILSYNWNGKRMNQPPNIAQSAPFIVDESSCCRESHE